MPQNFTIAPLSDGLDESVEPWLLPQQAFVDMQNAFVHRGVLQKRSGYAQLATGGEGGKVDVLSRLVVTPTRAIDDESLGSTDGAGAATGTLASPGVDVGTVTVSIAGAPAEAFTDDGNGVLTGDITGTGTINYNTGAWTITGSNLTQAITADYTSAESLASTDGAGALSKTLSNIPARPGIVVKVAGATVENFTDDGAGVLTGDITGTGTIDYTTGVLTLTGSNASKVATCLYDYHQTLPVMGLYNYINANSDRRLCALDTRNFNQYNTTTNRFDYIVHSSATTYTGADYDYWSAANYSVLDTSTPKFQRILVFTNGIDKLQYFNGTNTDDFDQIAGYAEPPAGIGGDLDTCKLVFYYGDRLCCLNVKQDSVWYPQRLLYSSTVGSGNATTFDDARAGVVDAPTDDEIMGADFLSNDLVVFFRDSVWALKITQDRFFPFRWERIDVKGVVRCDSRFSVSSYFGEVQGTGRLGIIGTNGNQVSRIDNKLSNFTRVEIDPELFQYCYAIETEKKRQRWLSYADPEDGPSRATKILVNDVEENNWSVYTFAMHCFGNYHVVGFDTLWDEFAEDWDTYGRSWDDYTQFKQALTAVGGDYSGYVFQMDTGGDDDRTDVKGITQANPAVVTVNAHRLATGDFVKVYEVSGMTEIVGLDSIVTVLNTTSFQLNSVDSTDFTAYSSDGFVEKAIAFDVKTKPLNPWIKEDSKAVLHWVDLRVDSSAGSSLNVQFFTEERDQPYVVTDQTSDTISLDLSDDSNRPIKWIRVYVGSTAFSHQIRLFQQKADQPLRIHAIRLSMSQAGSVEGGN